MIALIKLLQKSYPEIPFDPKYQSIFEYFFRNHFKRRPVVPQYNEDWKCLVAWIKSCAKTNYELKELLDSNYGSDEEGIVGFISGSYKPVCPDGRNKAFSSKKASYGFCASKGCECFRKFVSDQKAQMSPEQKKQRSEKYEATMMKKYGVRNASQQPEMLDKMKASINGRTKEQRAEQLRKRRETSIERYGEIDYTKTEEYSNRRRKTWENTPDEEKEKIKEKMKATCMERFGVDNPTKLPKIQKIIMNGFWNSQDEIRLKKQKNSGYSDETIGIISDKKRLSSFIEGKTLRSIIGELGISETSLYRYLKNHDIQLFGSSYERAISAVLDELKVEYQSNIRTIIGTELDFYIPSHSFAIEFNGLYWHSTAKRPDPKYHLKKHLSCRDKGIRLLMINEDEWDRKSEIIISKITNLCGLSERGVGARKLRIEQIITRNANEFFTKHHLQGPTYSTIISYGAYEGEEMVGAMSFGRQRGTSSVELTRYCTDGKVYSGLFSKLFRTAVRENSFDEIISFADLRYSDGGVYEKNGFVLRETIRHDYRYVKGCSTFHKSSFTKSKIAKKFNIDMSNLTEREAMEMLGYHRIWDCGKLKYVWKR